MKKRVVLCSWGQLDGEDSNLGDRLIFETQLEILTSRYKLQNIFAMSSNVDYTNKKYNIQSTNPFTIFGFIRFVNYIRKSDLTVVGGGELIQDKSSKAYILFNLFPIVVSKIFRKNVIALAIGISDKNEISRFGRIVSKFCMNQCDDITVRDTQSLRNASDLGIKANINLSSDIVFYNKCEKKHKEPLTHINDNKYIIVSVRNTSKRKSNLLPASFKKNKSVLNNDFDQYLFSISEVLNTLINNYNYKVILWPTYIGAKFSSRDDIITQSLGKKIHKKENVQIINNNLSKTEIFEMLSKAEFIITTPLHAMIMAILSNCPIISLSYANKCRNLMETIGLVNFMIDISKNDLSNFDETVILKRINEMIKYKKQIKEKINAEKIKLINLSYENLLVLDKYL